MDRYEWVRTCVTSFSGNGLIINYKLKKEEAKSYYNTNLKPANKKKNFFTFMWDLIRLRIIKQRPANFSSFEFYASTLDSLLTTDTLPIPPQNTVIVTQSLAFGNKRVKDQVSCMVCKKKFETKAALNQHMIALSHIVKNPKVNQNRFDNDKDVVIVVEGCENDSYTVYRWLDKTVKVTVVNLSEQNVSLESMLVMNAKWKKAISNNFTACVLTPKASTTIVFTINDTDARFYDYPLAFGYTKDGAVFTVYKHLYIDCHPDDFKDLHATSPYVKNKTVVKDLNEQIVPGEFPEQVYQYKKKLKSYTVPKDIISVLNNGLKKGKVEFENTRSDIIKMLNVPNASNCLNVGNYTNMLNLLLYIEEHQMQIDIRSYDKQTNGDLSQRGHKFRLKVPDLSEHRPSLVVGDSVYLKEPNSKVKYQGIVHFKGLDYVDLGFDALFQTIFSPAKLFDVSFGYNRTVIKLEHRAVNLVREHRIASYLFPAQAGTNKLQNLNLNFFNAKIKNNVEQQTAIRHILSNSSFPAPYLIFGPPGTGKTVTMVEAILQIWKTQPSKRILICTPSNNAANEINKRICQIPTTDLLRYISYSFPQSEIPEEVYPYCNYSHSKYYQPNENALASYKIIITTLSTAGRLDELPLNHFSYVFIDESGHATESETLIAIAGILSNKKENGFTGQLVMAGDPQQLGPITHSALAKKYGFGTSMLERFMNTLNMYQKHDGRYDSNVLTKLLVNYRSHAEILKISNAEFYDNELIASGGDFTQLAMGDDLLPNKKFPMIFHCVTGKDEREASSPSFFNVQEVKVVVDYLKILIGKRMKGKLITEDMIGIITPYRRQVQKIKKKCNDMKLNTRGKLTIGSVEQFQGQEKEIIIISTVRSKPEYIQHDFRFHLGFLKNAKRFNVALTRAKALVIVIGNPDILQQDKYWRAYIETCMINRSTRGGAFTLSAAPTFEEEVEDITINFEQLMIGGSNDDSVNFSRGQQ